MSDSQAENNKAIVLDAFETLFNKRDYAAAERFWSSKYIQHSAHIPTVSLGVTYALAYTYGSDDDRIWSVRCAVIVAGLDDR